MSSLDNLNIKIYADGADLETIRKLAENPLIKGFTTNPSLLKKAGVTDYKKFAIEAAAIAGERPISFEVFADDLETMEKEARIISTWGKNVFVKIPVTNSHGISTAPIITELSHTGVKLNITAITTNEQANTALNALDVDEHGVVSIFCGRIADTGINPYYYVETDWLPHEYLWASPRQLLDIFLANEAGFDIITVTPEILSKLHLIGKDLNEYSLETVQMFLADAKASGLTVE